MSGDHGNHVMTSLGIDSLGTLDRFLRAISDRMSDASTLHLYEHRNKTFSLHGHPNITTALSLLETSSHVQTELPPTKAHASATPTLTLDAATARSLVSSALHATGCRVVVWTVSADARISSSMEGTPGCPASLSDWLGDRADDGVIMAVRPIVKQGVCTIGVAIWQPMRMALKVVDVHDSHDLAILETLFISLNVREVVIPDDVVQFDKSKLEDMAQKCSLALTVRKKKIFDANSNTNDLLTIVSRLCSPGGNLENDATVNNAQLRFNDLIDNKIYNSCISALLEYCNLDNNVNLQGKLSISPLSIVNYMLLDNCVMKALNILPFPGDGGKSASLFGLLNKCKISMGSKLLKSWLSQPLQNIDQINDRLDIVDSFVALPELLKSIRETHLNKIPDLQYLSRKFVKNEGTKSTMEDIVKLYQCAVRIPVLCGEIEHNLAGDGNDGDEESLSILKEKFTKPLLSLCEELKNFETLVEMTIDLEKISNGEFCIAPSIDPELKRLKAKQDEILEKISSEYEGIKYDLSDTVKLERKDNVGYLYRLTRKEERMIRGKSKYIVIETRKDGVRFQTTQLRKLSRNYEEIAEEYSQLEKDMRDKTLDVAATYIEVFLDVSAILAQLDVLTTFAVVSQTSRSTYVRPIMVEAGKGLVIKQARHPIVEENLPDDVGYIANDIDLRRTAVSDSDGDTPMDGEGEDDGGCLALVTGPNMGGKSTYIRSAGVLTLMAHVGMHVPADDATIPVTDRIFARVGAADNQHRAVSTFMSEMLETAAILRGATRNSLVIIDELGRGTGTTDGYGLAYAIGKHIAHEIRCACLFATHFYELTALADAGGAPVVRNLHVTAVADGRNSGSGGLTFLYEVRSGACDQSFGVHVAEMAHFPPAVTEGARLKAKEMEMDGGSKEVHDKLAAVDERTKEKGLEILAEFEKKRKKLGRGDDDQVKQSVKKLMKMKKELEQYGNKYVDILLGIA